MVYTQEAFDSLVHYDWFASFDEPQSMDHLWEKSQYLDAGFDKGI